MSKSYVSSHSRTESDILTQKLNKITVGLNKTIAPSTSEEQGKAVTSNRFSSSAQA